MKDKLEAIQKRIRRACEKVERDPKEVTLVAISKKQSIEKIREAYDLGIRDFGENYLQELLEKKEKLPIDIRWHFVGHLQSKKIKDVPNDLHLIHAISTDSQIHAWEKRAGSIPPLLIQVNIAGEDSKFGVSPSELSAFCKKVRDFPIQGLMCFPPYQADPELNRTYFSQTKACVEQFPDTFGQKLSMGVSNDFEIAIQEGATHIRIGTELMGERQQSHFIEK